MSSPPLIKDLFEKGCLSSLDYYLAKTLARIAKEDDPLVHLGVAVACKSTTLGHICADLKSVTSRTPQDRSGEPVADAAWPEMKDWLQALHNSSLVGDGTNNSPLVLENDHRLYLGKYWDLQQRLVEAIKTRVETQEPLPVDEELLKKGLDQWFENSAESDETDWQKVAAISALLNNFSIISGGPGTGKTYTVVKILALLLDQARKNESSLQVDLLAPTGKAAAVLENAIKKEKEKNQEDLFRDTSFKASTIHRRLGFGRGRPGSFLHDRKNPISSDVVIVDEASMIDLALMTRLVEAVPPGARLILLGDENQLASVEAGAIFGDICKCGEDSGWSPSFFKKIKSLTGNSPDGPVDEKAGALADCIVELKKSRRFTENSGIAKISSLIRDGDAAGALNCLLEGNYEDLSLCSATNPQQLYETTRKLVLQGYRNYLEKSDPEEKLEDLNLFRILCAHRHGLHGVENLNRVVETILQEEGLIECTGNWYPGRPIMITENDYQLKLFNGDIGLITSDSEDGDTLRAQFPSSEGGVRKFSPASLPAHETVFATTIHKSQGSEFKQVFIILPNNPSTLLSRELLYTAITRAKDKVVVLGDEKILSTAIEKQIERASGLRDALWGAG